MTSSVGTPGLCAGFHEGLARESSPTPLASFRIPRWTAVKILFLAHRIPYPPNKGEKIRAYEELQFLAARGHTIDLFCFADSAEEAEGQQALRLLCRHVYVETFPRGSVFSRALAGLWARQPLSVACFRSGTFKAAVRRALDEERYDLIFVYCISVAEYATAAGKTPVVIDFVDADSAKWAQYARYSSFPFSWLYAREARLLSEYERKAARAAQAAVVATPLDAAQLGGGVQLAAEVISNGVSLPPGECASLPEEIRRLQPYAVFTGTMNYRPNVDAVVHFAEEILPRIRERQPELGFMIVGRNPARRVRRLARQPGVIVTGGVDDVRRYLKGAAVSVAPFRIAQGFQNKILEAMAVGLPVVSTSGPARALGLQHGEDLLIADTPGEFSRAVLSVLEDASLRSQLQRAAASVRGRFNWSVNLSRLERLLANVVKGPHAACVAAENHAQVR